MLSSNGICFSCLDLHKTQEFLQWLDHILAVVPMDYMALCNYAQEE